MRKLILSSFLSFFIVAVASAQKSKEGVLVIVDSIIIVQNLEELNQIDPTDISDITIIKNRDSLDLLGWGNLEAVTYIFTKAYRNRPDSIKKIPSLKQMEIKDGLWNLDGRPYTGRYIDYYISGMMQNDGYLLNGKVDGPLTIYFKKGMKQSTTNYKNGIAHGFRYVYYKNGTVRETREIVYGKDTCGRKTYFSNGQIQYERICGRKKSFDTIVTYFSSGKIREIELITSDGAISSKKNNKLGYYNTMFTQSMNAGNLKKANKYFQEISFIDGASVESKFKEGWLRLKESKYDEAIGQFDKVLDIEPLMTEALLLRGVARIEKYRAIRENALASAGSDFPITIEDMQKIPASELDKICSDLLKVDENDPFELLLSKHLTETVLKYCRK